MLGRMILSMAACGVLVACEQPLASGAHWREVGSIGNGVFPLVQIDAAFAKDGSVYRDAAKQVCTARCFQVGFFIPGDKVPPSESREAFFEAGVWGGYSPAAIYNAGNGEFTKWDCAKAGDADAPLSALCGEGAKEEFDAVLHLASRDGWTTGCGLPATDNRALLDKYIATLSPPKRDSLIKAYQDMLQNSQSGPDDHADCQNLRPRIEGWQKSSRAFLSKRMSNRAVGAGAKS
jgi:hypothetical protein